MAAKSNIQDGFVPQHQDCYEGEQLVHVLKSIQRGIDSTRVSAGNSLPEKVWLKQQFAIGVNDAILLASDCNPKWLTKHIPTIARSRKVPLIIVRDDKKGSLRLGELVKLKTTIAIGVKARGSVINRITEGIIDGDELKQGAALQV
ncbi:Pectin lyase-like superfamily protein isoform 1 [Hibiscus syriacus]|uniref:Pectin lyase-like superfamily protein isoform 1 n=1 Tax=Hibiscus syriacus TaxID=106335 RepID=A0A6A3A402_HIBSY|nr:Pectin lyase-like superfamily protein isoform 1 [Hibiscus syriacus]